MYAQVLKISIGQEIERGAGLKKWRVELERIYEKLERAYEGLERV